MQRHQDRHTRDITGRAGPEKTQYTKAVLRHTLLPQTFSPPHLSARRLSRNTPEGGMRSICYGKPTSAASCLFRPLRRPPLIRTHHQTPLPLPGGFPWARPNLPFPNIFEEPYYSNNREDWQAVCLCSVLLQPCPLRCSSPLPLLWPPLALL